MHGVEILVDQVLSQEVLPAFAQGGCITSEQALASAMARFDRQPAIGRANRLHENGFNPTALGEDFVAFHALEYGGVLEVIRELRKEDIFAAVSGNIAAIDRARTPQGEDSPLAAA